MAEPPSPAHLRLLTPLTPPGLSPTDIPLPLSPNATVHPASPSPPRRRAKSRHYMKRELSMKVMEFKATVKRRFSRRGKDETEKKGSKSLGGDAHLRESRLFSFEPSEPVCEEGAVHAARETPPKKYSSPLKRKVFHLSPSKAWSPLTPRRLTLIVNRPRPVNPYSREPGLATRDRIATPSTRKVLWVSPQVKNELCFPTPHLSEVSEPQATSEDDLDASKWFDGPQDPLSDPETSGENCRRRSPPDSPTPAPGGAKRRPLKPLPIPPAPPSVSKTRVVVNENVPASTTLLNTTPRKVDKRSSFAKVMSAPSPLSQSVTRNDFDSDSDDLEDSFDFAFQAVTVRKAYRATRVDGRANTGRVPTPFRAVTGTFALESALRTPPSPLPDSGGVNVDAELALFLDELNFFE